jgi:hypothetical protein
MEKIPRISRNMIYPRSPLLYFTLLWLILDKYNLFNGVILGIYICLAVIALIYYLSIIFSAKHIVLDLNELEKDYPNIKKEEKINE